MLRQIHFSGARVSGVFYLLSARSENRPQESSSLVWFYGVSTIVGYLIPNPFLNI